MKNIPSIVIDAYPLIVKPGLVHSDSKYFYSVGKM